MTRIKSGSRAVHSNTRAIGTERRLSLHRLAIDQERD